MKLSAIKFFTLLLIFFVTFQLSNAQVKAVNGKKISKEKLDAVITSVIDSSHFPGLSVAFINNGKIVFHKEYGYANLEKKVKVDENTVFEACSMSKPVFALFIMKMVDKGVIALDTPLYKYAPYPDIAYDERYKLFTARMVLCHTTGLPNWHEYQPADSSLHVPKGAQYIMFQPGTQFSYSGEGYQYLVTVIAKLLNTTMTGLADIVDKEVCKPLKMIHARFGWNDYVAQHKAIGYKQTKDDGVNKQGELKKFEEFSAAGGLHTNAIDYANFMIGMLDGKVLSNKSHTEMLSPQATLTDTSWINSSGKYWGLGISIKETPYGIRYSHSGNNGDFQCFSVIFKDTRSGFVFLTNCNRSGDLFDKLEPLFMEGK